MRPIVHDDHRTTPATKPAELPTATAEAPRPARRQEVPQEAPAMRVEATQTESDLFVIDTAGDPALAASHRRTLDSNVQMPTFASNGTGHLSLSDSSDDDEDEIVYIPPKASSSTSLNVANPSPSVPSSTPATTALPSSEAEPSTIPVDIETSSPPLPAVPSTTADSIPLLPGKSVTASRKANKRAAKREARKGRRARANNGAAGDERIARGDSDVEWGSDGPPSRDVDELAASLKANDISDAEGMDVDDEDDLSFAASFVASMDAKNQVSTNDLEAEAAIGDSEGTPWQTDPEGDSASDAESIIAKVEQERYEGFPSLDKGKAKAVGESDGSDEDEDSSDTDEVEIDDDMDEEDDLLVGGWGDADVLLDAQADLLQRGNRAKRNKIFRAIERGDFSDMIDDEDDFTLQPRRKDIKGKGKAKQLNDADTRFIADLQAQWERDRASKAERKRSRAAARAASRPTKKELKKAKRRTGDEADALAKHDLSAVHFQIREFALDIRAGPALGLPPTSKRQRVAVHLLAECYGLNSKSIGKGANRSPMLHRTPRTAVHGVDPRKVASIIGIANTGASTPGGDRPRGRMGALWRELDGSGEKSRASPVAKNKDGAVVGHGADALDEGNMGYKLLARMGWTAGERIGVSGGIDQPLNAVIKTSRRGLGH